MRVLLDTNVPVSAALKRHSTPGLAAHLVEKRCVLIKSISTELQLFEVVARPYFATLIDPEARIWLRKLMTAAELITIAERIAACRDPTDDKFLETRSQRQGRRHRFGRSRFAGAQPLSQNSHPYPCRLCAKHDGITAIVEHAGRTL